MKTPLEALEHGAIVLFPNQRTEQYWSVRWLQQHGSGALPGNRLYGLNRWLRELWLSHPDALSQRLLSDRHAQCWWAAHVFKDHPQLSVNHYIPLAYQAFQRCQRWKAGPKELRYWPLNGQQKKFVSDFEKCLILKNQEECLFPDDLIALASDHHWLSQLPTPTRSLAFFGFDDWTPLQRDLLKTLENWAPGLYFADLPQESEQPSAQVLSYKFASEEQERQAALQWLKDQPLADRCAVIVPDMSRDFRVLQQQLQSDFEPDMAILPLEEQSRWVAFSAGTPLLEVPFVKQLVAALKGEPHQRGSLVDEKNWQYYRELLPAEALWDQHLATLQQGLHHQNWLGDSQLSSQEYQAAQALMDSLTQLHGLLPGLGPFTSAKFLSVLELDLSLAVFQPQSRTDKKMVLGLLEAAALPWDAVWLTKGSSQHYPPPLSPHPLLPAEWQYQSQLPHAHPQREWQYFQKLLQRLFQSVKNVCLSCPTDWAPLWQIWHIELSEHVEKLIEIRAPKRLPQKQFFEQESVKYPSTNVSVSDMGAFTQCPFKGWAMNLPQARPKQEPHPLFDARITGNIAHRSVQQYLQKGCVDWQHDPDLCSWPNQLREYLQKQLESSCAQLLEKTSLTTSAIALEVERSFRYPLGPLTIEGRADLFWPQERVVDIKTANPIVSHWFHESPKNWQGAIYALALDVPVLGLLRIAVGKAQYWETETAAFKEQWLSQLQSYAQHWMKGLYTPSPKDLSYCTHCPFQHSCRYHAQEAQ